MVLVSASQVVLVVKNSPASVGDTGDPGLIPELGRSPGEGNSYPLQYSVLENSRDGIVHGVAKSPKLVMFTSLHFYMV